MADYFQEMGWTPLANGEAPDNLMLIARFFIDSGIWELSDAAQKLPPPASKESVKNLKEEEYKSDADGKIEQCPVCIKEYESGILTKTMPCKHFFHTECITPWLEKTNSCPVCRYELRTDDETYENYKKEKQRAAEREKDLETLHNSMFS